MNDYETLLNRIEKIFAKFIKVAKKIKPEDKSIEMMSLKNQAMLYNIEVRGLLNKYRNSK